VTGNDVTWPQVTLNHLEVAVLGRKLACTVHFTSYKAVARRRQSRDLRWLEVPRKWRHLTESHLKVAVVGWQLAYNVHFTSYKAVARRRRQSRDRKWLHVTWGDRKWPGRDVIDRKSPGSGCRRPKTGVYCTFHFLQGCSSQEAVTWREMTLRDLRWRKWLVKSFEQKSPGSGWRRPKGRPYSRFRSLRGCISQEKALTWRKMTSRDFGWLEVTRKWRHLTGSHLEVAVDGRKLAYTLHLTSYKPVARRR